MPKVTNRMKNLWVVDDCADANGNYTVRIADGGPYGDTDCEPVATVYGLALAEHIVASHNDGVM